MALAKFMTIRQPHPLLGACGLVWSMLVALGAIDPGSNPGRPTTIYSGGRASAGYSKWVFIASISNSDTAALMASSLVNHLASSISSSLGEIS